MEEFSAREIDTEEQLTAVNEEGKAFHIYTDDEPKVTYYANKYYVTFPSSKKGNNKKKDDKEREKERRPYNQVNVYVHFDDMSMMNDKLVVKTKSNMHGGSTTIEEEENRKKNAMPKCGPEQAIINGVCVDYAK